MIIISLLALLATFYQLYLQRLHNEKSLKPLGQIEVSDRRKHIYVYIQNKGLGPLIIDKVVFTKNGIKYGSINDSLSLDPKSYWHATLKDTEKVILPNTHLVLFDKNAENNSIEEIENIKKQLASITVKVTYRDIYDNKFCFERSLDWFSRYMIGNKNIDQ